MFECSLSKALIILKVVLVSRIWCVAQEVVYLPLDSSRTVGSYTVDEAHHPVRAALSFKGDAVIVSYDDKIESFDATSLTKRLLFTGKDYVWATTDPTVDGLYVQEIIARELNPVSVVFRLSYFESSDALEQGKHTWSVNVDDSRIGIQYLPKSRRFVLFEADSLHKNSKIRFVTQNGEYPETTDITVEGVVGGIEENDGQLTAYYCKAIGGNEFVVFSLPIDPTGEKAFKPKRIRKVDWSYNHPTENPFGTYFGTHRRAMRFRGTEPGDVTYWATIALADPTFFKGQWHRELFAPQPSFFTRCKIGWLEPDVYSDTWSFYYRNPAKRIVFGNEMLHVQRRHILDVARTQPGFTVLTREVSGNQAPHTTLRIWDLN